MIDDDGTAPADPPRRWVCAACGKTSATRYGFDKGKNRCADPGWDESCMLHAVLCEPNPAGIPKWRAVLDG